MIALIGYVASVLLGFSLLVNNDLKFRWLNTFGCLAFIIYGVFINAFPIILTNTVLLLINLFYLIKIHRTKEAFDLLEFKRGDKIITKFLSFHAADINTYFPEFKAEEVGNEIRFVVLRDMVIANIFVASLVEDGTAEVKINYTVPKYRDYKVGRFIFDQEKKYLIAKGVKQILYKKVFNKNHQQFLNKMGFVSETLNNLTITFKKLV